jgi:sulfite reductase (NADPH) hemoprotein beta-component
MPDVMDKLLSTYVDLRKEEETFLQTYQRVGVEPFKERVYASPAA